MTTRIAFVGDVHIGNHKRFGGPKLLGINRRCQHVIDALKSAVLEAAASHVDALVILGDLFDSPNPTPQMLKQVQECCEIIPTIILSGNHDQCSDAYGDHALGPLTPVCEVVDAPDVIPLGDVDLFMVPFESGNCREWLPKRARQLARLSNAKHRVLCFHAGIISDHTPEFLKHSDAAISASEVDALCKELEIETVFAGHWHNRSEWTFENRTIIQAGALVPTGWNNPGFDYGTLFTHVTDKEKKVILRQRVDGPRFVDATPETFGDSSSPEFKPLEDFDDDEMQNFTNQVEYGGIPMGTPEYEAWASHTTLTGRKLYMRIFVDASEVALGQAILNAGIESETIIDGELVISKTEIDEANKQAAKETQSTTTLEEALGAFVEAMALKGIDDFDALDARHEIHKRTKKYMDGNNAD